MEHQNFKKGKERNGAKFQTAMVSYLRSTLDQKFQRPQEGLYDETLICSVVT